MAEPTIRLRREPPRFRHVTIRRVEQLTPRMRRVTIGGPELADLEPPELAASVRLLLPAPDAHEVVVPAWNGNEFLLADGTRPIIRTLTPLRFDQPTEQLDVEVVMHDDGPLSGWARSAEPGSPVALSGPGRGYSIDLDAPAFLLAGDESAMPAIGQLLDALPREAAVQVCIEVAHPEARLALPDHPHATVEWLDLPAGGTPGDVMAEAVRHAEIGPDTRVWVAGEAAAVQRIRRHCFEERSVPRAHATIRGYWKRGRAGDG
jgi:NADPH-dependent ferric siderophore reductase